MPKLPDINWADQYEQRWASDLAILNGHSPFELIGASHSATIDQRQQAYQRNLAEVDSLTYRDALTGPEERRQQIEAANRILNGNEQDALDYRDWTKVSGSELNPFCNTYGSTEDFTVRQMSRVIVPELHNANPEGAPASLLGETPRAYEARLNSQIGMTGGDPYRALGLEPNMIVSQRDIDTRLNTLAEQDGQVNLANAVHDLIGTQEARARYARWSTSGSPQSPFTVAPEEVAAVEAAVPQAVAERLSGWRNRFAAAKKATAEAFTALAETMSDDIAPAAVPRTLTISDKDIGTGYEATPKGYNILLPDAQIVPAVWNEAKDGKPGFWEYEDPNAAVAKPGVPLGQRISNARQSLNEFGDAMGARLATLKAGAIDVVLDHVAMPQAVRERILNKFVPADGNEGFVKVEINAEALMNRGDESITQHAGKFDGIKGRFERVRPQSGFADLTEVSFNAANGTFSVADAAEGERIAAVAASKGKIAVWLPESQEQALKDYATSQNDNAAAQAKAAIHKKFEAKFEGELKTAEGDPYKTLGVSHDATQEQIKQAYEEMQTRVSKLKANIPGHDQMGLAQTYDRIQEGVTAKADAAYELIGTEKARARFNQFATESGSALVSPELDTAAIRTSMAKAAEMSPKPAIGENEHSVTSAIGRAFAFGGLMVKAKEIQENGLTTGAATSIILDTAALKNPSTAIAAQAFGIAQSTVRGYEQGGVAGATVEGSKATVQTGVSAELMAPGAVKAIPSVVKSLPGAVKNVPGAVKEFMTPKGFGDAAKLLTKEGALQRGASLLTKAGELAQPANLAKGLTKGAGLAGDMALAQSFIDTTSDAVAYARGTKELNMDSYTQTAITAVMDLDPLKVATFGLTSTDKIVGKVEGHGHKSVGETINEINAIYAENANAFHASYRDEKATQARDGKGLAPSMRDYSHLAAIAPQLAKYLPDGKIDGHSVVTGAEFRQIDMNDPKNMSAYGRALNKAILEQKEIMEANQSIMPRFLRSSESGDKFNEAESQYKLLDAARTEYLDYSTRNKAYRAVVAAQQADAAAGQTATDANTPANAAAADTTVAAGANTPSSAAPTTASTANPTAANPATTPVSDDQSKEPAVKKGSWLDEMQKQGGILGFIAMIIEAIFSLFGGGQQADSGSAPAAGTGTTSPAATTGDDKAAVKPVATMTPEQLAEAKKQGGVVTSQTGTGGQGADADHAAPIVPGTTSAAPLAQNSGQNVP